MLTASFAKWALKHHQLTYVAQVYVRFSGGQFIISSLVFKGKDNNEVNVKFTLNLNISSSPTRVHAGREVGVIPDRSVSINFSFVNPLLFGTSSVNVALLHRAPARVNHS